MFIPSCSVRHRGRPEGLKRTCRYWDSTTIRRSASTLKSGPSKISTNAGAGCQPPPNPLYDFADSNRPGHMTARDPSGADIAIPFIETPETRKKSKNNQLFVYLWFFSRVSFIMTACYERQPICADSARILHSSWICPVCEKPRRFVHTPSDYVEKYVICRILSVCGVL
jgi:hypothetical protein